MNQEIGHSGAVRPGRMIARLLNGIADPYSKVCDADGLCTYRDESLGISFSFRSLPTLIPVPLDTHKEGFLAPLRGASSRRLFELSEDWKITIEFNGPTIDGNLKRLNGTVVIPVAFSNQNDSSEHAAKTILDGASVPSPWVISFLSFGLLRPLGVMLTASVVHDFAFQHGGLLYVEKYSEKDDQQSAANTFQHVERHEADYLFRSIIRIVNKMPLTAALAWLAVRLGWYFVDYNGHPRDNHSQNGHPPIVATMVLVAIILGVGIATYKFGFSNILIVAAIVYTFIYVLLAWSAYPSRQQR